MGTSDESRSPYSGKIGVSVGLVVVGIGLTVVSFWAAVRGENSQWSQGAGARLALLFPTDLVISVLLLIAGKWLLDKLTGDTMGQGLVGICVWVGVYYLSFGVAMAAGVFGWWLLGCLVFVIVPALAVRVAFSASGLGCVLAVAMLAVVRGMCLLADILLIRTLMP